MSENKKEKDSFFLNVLKVEPKDNFTVDVYFDNSDLYNYDCKFFLNSPLMSRFNDVTLFKKHCCIQLNSLSWYLGNGTNDEINCFDVSNSSILEKGTKL